MKTYETVQGDTWDIIARKLYGDEAKAQDLMQERGNILLLDIEIFPAGINVTAPDIDADGYDVGDLPEWRKD